MICQRCRRTGILSRFLQQPQQALRSAAPPTPTPTPTLTPRYQIPTLQQRAQTRAYSDGKPSVAPPPPSAPRQPVSDDVSIPSAISSATPGISQPLSTAGGVHAEVRPDQPTAAEQRVPSTCPVGMKMGGLSYEKNKPEIFALEDSEYPDWLWGLLKEFEEKEKADKGGVDPSTMNKKQRKRHEKKLAAQAAALPPKIPVHHQASDLTPASYNHGDQPVADALAEATEGLEKRTQVTKSARDARRQEIRESNFLRSL